MALPGLRHLFSSTAISVRRLPRVPRQPLRPQLPLRARTCGRQGLRSGVDYDDELVFLSCILHDLGVTDYADGDQRFEVDGADGAARFLHAQGISDHRVTTVWQTIALHTSVGLADRFGPEQSVSYFGISLDINGIETGLLSPGFAERVH